MITAARALGGAGRRRPRVPALLQALARITAEKRDTSRDARMAILESRSRSSAGPTAPRDADPARRCAPTSPISIRRLPREPPRY